MDQESMSGAMRSADALMRAGITEQLHTQRRVLADPEICYVISGRAELTVRGRTWILQKDDFLLTEAGEWVEMSLEDRGMAGILALRREACAPYLETDRYTLRMSSLDATDRSIGRARHLLSQFFSLLVSEDVGREAMLCALYVER